MNNNDINKLSLEEIEKTLVATKTDLSDLVYKNGINDLKDYSSISKSKKLIARLLTRKNVLLEGVTNGEK